MKGKFTLDWFTVAYHLSVGSSPEKPYNWGGLNELTRLSSDQSVVMDIGSGPVPVSGFAFYTQRLLIDCYRSVQRLRDERTDTLRLNLNRFAVPIVKRYA